MASEGEALGEDATQKQGATGLVLPEVCTGRALSGIEKPHKTTEACSLLWNKTWR